MAVSLAELRLAIGRKGIPMRQLELAQLAKVSQSYLSQIEAGAKRPSPYMILRLAAALKVDPEDYAASLRETLRRQKLGEAQIRFSS